MWKCPECETEVTELYYSVPTNSSESGTASIDMTPRLNRDGIKRAQVIDYEYDSSGDSEWNGDPEFECRECNNNILLSELIWIEGEEEKVPPKSDEPEETLHNIVSPVNRITMRPDFDRTLDSTLMCKNCSHLIVFMSGERGNKDCKDIICECPKCGETTSEEEFKKLLNIGFFDIKEQKNDKPKIKHKHIKLMGKSRK